MVQKLALKAEIPKEQVEEKLLRAAIERPNTFTDLFFQLRKQAPPEALRACLRYVAEYGTTELAKAHILPWLAMKNYFDALMDVSFLPVPEARNVAALMRAGDPQFFVHVSRLKTDSDSRQDRALLRRALSVLDGLPESSAIYSWLKSLTASNDERIRSQAVKVTCKMQASPALIQRQLQSEDDRVRANAVEALWGHDSAEARQIFEHAVQDLNHRVVMNALVGLHYQGDTEAFQNIVDYTLNPFELYRAAAVWALGHLADARAIPALKALVETEAAVPVRLKAQRVLAELLQKAERSTPAQAG